MADDYWVKLHELYSEKDWVTKPSIFTETVRNWLPKSGKLLELGAGLGQDSAYFTELGFDVTATDLNIEHLTELASDKFAVMAVDLRQPLPFADASFAIVYAHLSLHYFDQRTTEIIFDEIYRVLTPNGLLAFFTNSTDDPEFGSGKQIESNYFEIDRMPKRYLDVKMAKKFAHSFKPLLANNDGETYKDSAQGIHNLIQFIGSK